MTSANLLQCVKCGQVALVIHEDHPLCVECLMALVAQSRDKQLIMRDVKPLRFDQLNQSPPKRVLTAVR